MNRRLFAAFPAALLIGFSVPAAPVQASTATTVHHSWPKRAVGTTPTTRAVSPRLAPRFNSSQFLQDTSFSAGPNGTAWEKSTNGGRTLIDGNHPRTAPYSVDLCQDAANCQDGVRQLITRPGYIISATLTYWFTLKSTGDVTGCTDALQIGMEQPGGGPGNGVTYCPDWNGAPYVQDSIDETAFLRNMQSQTGEAYVVVAAISNAAGASRYWVDDITLDIVWATAPGQPTGVLAEPHNGSVTLHWQAPPPASDPITGYALLIIPANDSSYGYTIDSLATTAVVVQLVNGEPYSFKVAASNAGGQGPYSATSNTVTPAVTLSYERVSTQQFGLANSDGVTWHPVGEGLSNAGLALTVTTPGDSWALVTANADLWTSTAGVNQDLGISVKGFTPGPTYPTVPGQPETWKESGGYNGTFSPNAAAVHAGLLLSGGSYEFSLVWKANKPTPGAIYAGAGPIGSDFSPTRLTVQVFPMAANRVFDSTSTNQFHPTTPSDGVTFQDLGPGSPAIHFVASGNGVAILAGNADLWTATAGFNQDLAIAVNGSVAAWKESGSFGGTFSPNAALVETVIPVASSMTYDIKLQWKPNHDSYHPPIYAGAGPIGGKYSPTRLILYFIPNATLATSDASSSQQYTLPANDGQAWRDVDASKLTLSITPPSDCLAILTGNADLWTARAGFNQDLGIAVSSALGTYNSDRVGWKESGAVIGTYSPNAAYVQSAFPMAAGIPYTVKLQWKSNRPQSASTIYTGAGTGAPYSPTRLTAELVCPPVPVVTSISPSSGPSSGGTMVTINISNMANLDKPAVFFGATQAVVTSWSATQIVATTPVHSAGTLDVTVRTTNGTTATSPADRFTYVGSATHYALTAPTSATHGIPFNFSVTALDEFGNQVTDYHWAVRLTSTDTKATLPADYTFTPTDAGTHTFTATLNAGAWTITASEVGAAVPVTGTSATITVN